MGSVSDPTPMGASPDPFADTPLFRELQRILLAGSGPVNWELARQVAIATAATVGDDPEPSEEEHRGVEDAVRMAELAAADLTGMPPQILRAEVVRRARWVEASIEGLRGLFEPVATKVAGLLQQARGETAEEAPEGGGPMIEAVLGQLSPLLMGAQVGTVLGHLGQRTLSQYELPLPREGEPRLLVVGGNLAAFGDEWSLDPVDLRAWVAIHETTHALSLGRPWVGPHVRGLIRELAEGMEFDIAGLEARLAGLDPSNPAALSEAMGDPSELFGGKMTDERRLLVRRFQAFLAAAEGHADHLVAAIGRERLASFSQIEEAMRRRHEGRSEQERMAERVLGLHADEEQYRLGRAFCDHVAGLTDEPTLARMWGSADSLPSMPELEEPTLWLARMA